jgi:hypothetical protein
VTQVGLGSSPAPCPGRPCPLCLGAGVTLGLSVPGQDARGKLRPRTSQDLRRVPASPRPRVPAAARLPARVYIAAPKIGLGWPRGGVAAHGVASCPAKMFPADSGRALSVTGDTAGTGRPAGRGAGGLTRWTQRGPQAGGDPAARTPPLLQCGVLGLREPREAAGTRDIPAGAALVV